MKRDYLKPNILVTNIKVEAGFAVSDPIWCIGTPGGDIGYEDYEGEL